MAVIELLFPTQAKTLEWVTCIELPGGYPLPRQFL